MKTWHHSAAALAALLLSSSAYAQTAPQTDLPYGGNSSRADAWALRLNPANLGYLQGFHSALSVGMPENDETVTQVGWFNAVGTGRGFGFGIGGEWLRNPSPVHVLNAGFSVGMPRVAAGMSLHQYSSSADPAYDGLRLLDAGVMLRVVQTFGMSAVLRGFNRPTLRPASARRPLEFDLGFAVRAPDGRVVLDAAWTTIFEDTRRSVAVATVTARIWRGVRVFGSGSLAPLAPALDWRVNAGIEFANGPVLSTVSISSAQDSNSPGILASAEFATPFAFQDFQGGNVYHLQLGGELAERPRMSLGRDSMAFTDILINLYDVAEDAETDGLLLELRGIEVGPAQVWELRHALEQIRDAGKTIVVFLRSGGIKDLYLASVADVVLTTHDTAILNTGIGITGLYIGELLSHLDVEAQFVRIGAYKSAPERFTSTGPSEEARAQLNAYLDTVWTAWSEPLIAMHGQSEDSLNSFLNTSPLLPDALAEAGWVDAVIWPDELGDELENVFGGRVRLTRTAPRDAERNPYWHDPLSIAVLHISGGITAGESGFGLLTGSSSTGSRSIQEACQQISESDDLDGVIVRIDSPGGDAVASAEIWRALQRLGDTLPVVVSMGDVAGSGGYYAAGFGATIHATPVTLTGSIGIFAGTFNLEGLMSRLGVHRTREERGGPSAFFDGRAWTEDDVNAVQAYIQSGYDLFVERMAEGRDMSVEQIDAVGQGRIWSGLAALENGLVDTNEGFAGALAQIREASESRRGVPVRLVHMSLARLTGVRLAATALGIEARQPGDAVVEVAGAFSDVLGLTTLLPVLELWLDGGDTDGLAHMEWLFSHPL
jgi:protease-4